MSDVANIATLPAAGEYEACPRMVDGVCGMVDPTAGPEGAAWGSHFHCWRCGYDPGKPASVGAALAPAASSAEFARQVAARIHAELGLPEGVNLGAVLGDLGGAAQEAVAGPSRAELQSEIEALKARLAEPPA